MYRVGYCFLFFLSLFMPTSFLHRFFGVSGILFLMNILFYLYQLILTHSLSRSDYGDISSLLAWTILATIPSAVISMFVTRYVTLHEDDPAKQRIFTRSTFHKMIRMMPISFLVLVFLGWWIAPIFRLTFFISISILTITYLTIVLSFFRAILYAEWNLRKYAVNILFEVAFRIIVTLVLLQFTQHIGILYSVYLLSIFFSLLFFFRDIWDFFGNRVSDLWETELSKDEVSEMRSQLLPMILVSIFLTCVGSIEMVMARYMLSSDDLGKLWALIMIGKIVLAGLGIFIAVWTPYFSDSKKNKKNILILYGGICVSICLMFAVLSVWGKWIVILLFPAGYIDIVSSLISMGAMMSIVTIVTLLIQHASIAGKRSAGYLSPIILVSLLVSLYVSEPNFSWFVSGMLWGYSVGALLWVISFFIVFFFQSKKSSL